MTSRLKRAVGRLAVRLLVGIARSTDRWRKGPIPLFVYHSIDAAASPVSLSPARFRQQIGYLRSRGFRICSAGQALILGAARGRYVAFTFDDAYATVLPWVEEILEQGGRVTLFAPSGLLGKTNRWDRARDDIDRLEILPEHALRRLRREGCEIGSHTHSHANLGELDAQQALDELRSSKRRLEAALGATVSLLAYPYGAVNDQVMDQARSAGYEWGFTTMPGYAQPGANPLCVPRFSPKLDPLMYRLVVHRGYHWYVALQRLAYGLLSARNRR